MVWFLIKFSVRNTKQAYYDKVPSKTRSPLHCRNLRRSTLHTPSRKKQKLGKQLGNWRYCPRVATIVPWKIRIPPVSQYAHKRWFYHDSGTQTFKNDASSSESKSIKCFLALPDNKNSRSLGVIEYLAYHYKAWLHDYLRGSLKELETWSFKLDDDVVVDRIPSWIFEGNSTRCGG